MAGGLEVVWRKDLNMRPSASSLHTRGDVLVVAGQRSRLIRVDPWTGQSMWAATVTNAHGTAVIGDDTVMYLEQMGVLRCFELVDGSLRWSAQTEPFSGHVSISESCVITGGWRGYRPLAARDITDGQLLWPKDKYQTTDVHWPFVLGNGVLVSSRGSLVLNELNPRTGEIHRSWQLPDPMVSPDHEAAFATAATGSVIFRTGPSSVTELDDGELKEVWNSTSELGLHTPLQHGGMLWVPTTSGVAVVDLANDTSTEVRLNEGLVPGLSPDEDLVVVASRDGTVAAIDPDGTIRCRLQIARRAVALAQMSNGLTIVATKGELVAVQHQTS